MTKDPFKAALDAAHDFEPEPEMEVRCMSDVEMKPVRWLWYRRIALGKLTVIAGNPGLGKSQITTFLAAMVSPGGSHEILLNWPDAALPPAKGSVIILSAEDDAADTIKPRLLAAGADMSRCYVLEVVRIKNQNGDPAQRSFNLREDVARLEREIIRRGDVRLVIIDPISAYMGETDSNNNADMRGVLAPLAAMAAKHGVAVVLVTHMNKSKDQEPVARVIGSIGLIAAARAGYAVVKDQKEPEVLYFVPVKNNIGDDKNGFAFKIEEKKIPCGFETIETSRVVWLPDMVKAKDILNPDELPKPTQTNGAKDFLQQVLREGPQLGRDILLEAEGAGYSKASLQRAAASLGVKRRKLGMNEGWEWYFPLNDHCHRQPEDVEGCEDSASAGADTFDASPLSSEG
jgi:hypothetical protein